MIPPQTLRMNLKDKRRFKTRMKTMTAFMTMMREVFNLLSQ